MNEFSELKITDDKCETIPFSSVQEKQQNVICIS